MNEMSETVRREQMRGLCLGALDSARPNVMTDLALLPLINRVYPDADRAELRRELDYLALSDMLTIHINFEIWHLKLTGLGINSANDSSPPRCMPINRSHCMKIEATLTRCRHNNALVVLESRPFNGMEVRPADLRRMAQQLSAIADMADLLPLGGKHWQPTHVEIGGPQ